MSTDDRTLLANLRKERDLLISKLPEDQKAKLQRALDPAIDDADAVVTLRIALAKDMADYEAKGKALTVALKALRGKFNNTAERIRQGGTALRDARLAAKERGDAFSRVTHAYSDLSMRLLDFSPFQDVEGA